jgi:hypothetical protein
MFRKRFYIFFRLPDVQFWINIPKVGLAGLFGTRNEHSPQCLRLRDEENVTGFAKVPLA